MEFHRIRYFIEVCRQGRISKAAQMCNVSQPSLSLQIQKLEESLGGSLFLRNREGLQLTDLGKSFLPHAQAILAEVEAAQEFSERQKSEISGCIRIGAIPTIAPYVLPKILKAINAEHPAATFDIVEDTTESLTELMRSGTIEFALMSPPTSIDAEVDFLSIVQDELFVTIPQHHPLSAHQAISLESIQSEPLVLLKETHCLSQQCESVFRTARLDPEIRMRSSQIDTLLGIVEMGMGITFTPQMAVERHRGRGVSFHRISPQPYFREVRLMWMRRHQTSMKRRAVLKIVEGLHSQPKSAY